MAEITEIGIDTGALNRDTNALNATLNQICTEINRMYDAVAALNAMWDGPANEAFIIQFNNDHEAMQSICTAVQSLIRSMEDAGKKYNNSEQQAGSVVASISI